MAMTVDAAARVRALDPGASFIVQAPAGSGKTELLTQRLLALLATVRRPDEILAITFTRKAAAEMRQRLLLALATAHRAEPEARHQRRTWELARAALARDRECGWGLLETPALLAIQTIDGCNAGLVRRMPWTSRFGGMPQMSENPRRLLREAARRSLDRVAAGGRGSAAGARLLAHLDNRFESLQEMLVGMLQRRDQWLRHLGETGSVADRSLLEAALTGWVTATLGRAANLLPAGYSSSLTAIACYAGGNCDRERPLSRLVDLTGIPSSVNSDLPLWEGLADLFLTASGSLRKRLDKICGFPPGKEGEPAAMKDAMQKLLDDPALLPFAAALEEVRHLPPMVYAEDQWQVLQSLVELLKLTVAELWVVFGEAGETDFAEVALRALHSLREGEGPSDLMLRLDTRINHILVDEFQDTSYLQFALLKNLTEGWTGDDGRTLFLVGDPMQSIYRFREAEVGLFLRARDRGIGNLRLQPLCLSANFRSQSGIVDWVNQGLSRIFPPGDDVARGAVGFVPAVAVHPLLQEAAVTVHSRSGRDDAGEAAAIVGVVRQALAAGETSVAILVRSRSHLATVLPALRKAGLRYLAQEIDLLAERPVARDLVALTRALLHGGDRLSWLSLLRAPWCGLTLDDLHALCGEQRQAAIPDLLGDTALKARLSVSGQARLEPVWEIMQRGRRQRGRVGLRRLVEGCWLALGGPACYDLAALEDAARVFDLIDSLDCGGDLPALDLLDEELQRLYAAPDHDADPRLQVMTIHKAKGLEFDTVILPGLGRRPRSSEPPLLRWMEHPEHGLLLAPIAPRDGSRDPAYEAIGRLEREREALETVRLLYVAATRARHRLHLFGGTDTDAKGNGKAPGGSLLETLWPAVAELFTPSVTGTAIAIELNLEPRPLRLRRLTAGWRLPELAAAPHLVTVASLPPSRTAEAAASSIGVLPGLGARQAGTVTHILLERIAREGVDGWNSDRIAALDEEVRQRLIREGVPKEEGGNWSRRVLQSLARAVNGERGRWILSAHEVDHCELAISSAETPLAVLDRTFVEGGVRWVIDYKTSAPDREPLETFYAREIGHYRPQLGAYAALFQALEPGRKVLAALYFPYFDGWCEVPLGD